MFSTDRGERHLPAWRLGGPDVEGALWVLDPVIASGRWMPPEPEPGRPFDGSPHRAGRATMEGDDVSLRFVFTGGPPEYMEYPAAEVIESEQAIVVLPVERDTGPPGPRFLIGYSREVAVKLARPLGRRVLVDLDATPMTVQARPEL